MRIENCGNCKFSDEAPSVHGSVRMICQRYPPTLILENGEVERHLPFCYPDEWCGEYKDKKETFERM